MKIMILSLILFPNLLFGASDKSLTKLLNKMNDVWSGNSSKGQMTMEVKKQYFSRSMTMDMWSLGEDYFLTKIVKPKKDKGIASLKRNEDMYNYLPKINKTIRIGKAMLGGSWMGSHITNDDMVKMSRFTKEYEYNRKKDSSLKKDEIMVRLIPLKDSAVVWGGIDMKINIKNEYPVESTFYDQDMKPVRKFSYNDVKKYDGRYIPMTIRVTPLTKDQEGEYTEMRYNKLNFNVKYTDSWFSLSRLKR